MEYLRQTIDSAKLTSVFDLPLALRNKRVEVIIFPVDINQARENISESGSAYGCLKKYANPALLTQEEGAWA